MHFAVRAIAGGSSSRLRMWLFVTLGLGILFLIGQVIDYTTLGFGISDGVYGTVFYTLTGFHGAHVFGGVIGLTILAVRAGAGQFSARNHVAVEAVSYYWHFVDVVWLGLFTTLYVLG
jgi:cytochrome c oxidase subunit 3